MSFTLHHGDALDVLRTLPDGLARCAVTSPPYWGLRNYGEAGQMGLEHTPEEYVERLVAVMRELRRVLADDGTLWLNLGDSYVAAGGGGESRMIELGRPSANAVHAARGHGQTSGKTQPKSVGLPAKNLVGIPWRVAFALQADGWTLRSDIIWSKPNPMPESVTDRPTKAHEYLFLLSKSARYYYDAAAIAEPSEYSGQQAGICRGTKRRATAMGVAPTGNEKPGVNWIQPATRNARSVWMITTAPFPDAHFATFPEALVEPCILAGSARGDIVLDPFCGTGTAGVVALRHGRRFIGIDLSARYLAMAHRRIEEDAPLFNRGAASGTAKPEGERA